MPCYYAFCISVQGKGVEILTMALVKGIKLVKKVALLIGCLSIIAFFIFPFYWMLVTSFKDIGTAQADPPGFLFFLPTLENYRQVFQEVGFLSALKNSIIVTFFSLAANFFIGFPAAYVIARYRQRWLMFGIFFTQMMPWIVFLLAWFVLFKAMGLYDTYIGLVLSNLTYLTPFTIWMMLGFFEDIPVEVEEAAWLDGCSHAGTFFRIILPLTRNGIITISTLGFMIVWNIFIFPLVLSGVDSKTLPVIIYSFLADNSLDFGPLSAAAVLVTLPVLIFVMLNLKYFARGISLGGMK